MGKDGKKGLGMGLGALFGEEYPAPQPEREETAPDLLPIEKIEPRADQPRKRFDPEALEMLAESIRTYGLIQPITVRPLDGGFYQIIAGERRWRASRMAGLKEVPVRILTADEQRAMEMALVENLQREDLNPIEEAKGYRALQDVYGMTQDDVAQSVGKSRPAVANATRLLALSEPVLKLVEDGTKRLKDYYARAQSVSVTLGASDDRFDIGDVVGAEARRGRHALRRARARAPAAQRPGNAACRGENCH